jgi:hypothetical protein
VLELPPAPAARVLLGRALAIFSFWSAAARRLIAVRAPPGTVGLEGRAVLAPSSREEVAGEEARGEDIVGSTRREIDYVVMTKEKKRPTE